MLSASQELGKHYVRVLSALARVGYVLVDSVILLKIHRFEISFEIFFHNRDQHVVIRYLYEELNVSV